MPATVHKEAREQPDPIEHRKSGESGGWPQEAGEASRWSLSRIESGRDRAWQGLTLSWVNGENGTRASYHDRRRNGGRTSGGDCRPMIEEDRQLVTEEPVEFEK